MSDFESSNFGVRILHLSLTRVSNLQISIPILLSALLPNDYLIHKLTISYVPSEFRSLKCFVHPNTSQYQFNMHDFSPGGSAAILLHKAPDISNGLLMSHTGGRFYNFVEDSWILAFLDSSNLPTSITRLPSFGYNEFNGDSMFKTLERMTCLGPMGPKDDVHVPNVVRLPDKSARRDTAY
ncbi:hypothetical protein EYC80_009514 [Monilinia laxa]|uniref:Uncharacterized protein n=1 Tax=Monilinia laxa TaxID=61186 RepID=A0A5N6JY47_MONLA|nr:hypothetical protein EYC80_009514 [Monilinia laxa]